MGSFSELMRDLAGEANAPGAPAPEPARTGSFGGLYDDLTKPETWKETFRPDPSEMTAADIGQFLTTGIARGFAGRLDNLDPLRFVRHLLSPELQRIESGAPTDPNATEMPGAGRPANQGGLATPDLMGTDSAPQMSSADLLRAWQKYPEIKDPVARAAADTVRTVGQAAGNPGQAAGDALFAAVKPLGVEEFQPKTGLARTLLSGLEGATGGNMFGRTGAVVGGGTGTAGQALYEGTGSERMSALPGIVATGVLRAGGALTDAARARAMARYTPEIRATGAAPTGGMLVGGALDRFEQGMSSYPIAGDFIRGSRREVNDEIYRGRVNEVLEPFGGLNPRTASGRNVTDEMFTRIGDRYDNISNRLSVTPDRDFSLIDLGKINQDARMMPPQERAQFQTFIDDQLNLRLRNGNGTLTGPAFRELETLAGQHAREFGSSPDPNQRALGRSFAQFQGALRALQMRNNPAEAAELQQIHNAYADAVRLGTASGYIGSPNGIPGAAQYLRAVRENDPSDNHRIFARGRARMQQFADDVKNLAGDTVPDSGTPFRTLATKLPGAIGAALGIGGAAGGAAITPLLGLLAIPGVVGLGAHAAYSPAGRRAITELLTNQPTGVPPSLRGFLAAPDEPLRPPT